MTSLLTPISFEFRKIEASRRLGGSDKLIYNRLGYGWPLERAFSELPHA